MHVTMKVGGDMKNSLKTIRLKKGFTQVEVAEKAQISERGYQYIETGKRIPSVVIAQRIANVLNSSVEELFSSIGQLKNYTN